MITIKFYTIATSILLQYNNILFVAYMLLYRTNERIMMTTVVISPTAIESPITAKLSVSLTPEKRFHLSQWGLHWPMSSSKKKSSRQIIVESEGVITHLVYQDSN